MKRNIAIIPARGGSKRIPGKNIKELGGLPLIVHSINYAKNNRHIIHEIIVSTDDQEIKVIALSHGVKVVDRPSAISGDKSSTLEAVKHVVEVLEFDVKHIILLQPTNPLRPSELLNDAYQKLCTTNIDSLFTVSSVTAKLGKIVKNRFQPFNYSYGERSQDIEPFYRENGLLYITSPDTLKTDTLLSPAAIPFVINHPFADVDIDTEEDFRYAEFLIRRFGSWK